MPAFKDLTGKTFGNLTVIAKHSSDGRGSFNWACVCTCGNLCLSRGKNLASGDRKSCGCTWASVHETHGMISTPEYRAWNAMKNRCLNPRIKHYPNYGGRGITVCDHWLNDFLAFYSDMGDRPSVKHSIERKNNNLGYIAHNCKWATDEEQANNRRSSRLVFYKGKTMTIAQWANETGINYHTIYMRINRGWRMDDVFNRHVR